MEKTLLLTKSQLERMLTNLIKKNSKVAFLTLETDKELSEEQIFFKEVI